MGDGRCGHRTARATRCLKATFSLEALADFCDSCLAFDAFHLRRWLIERLKSCTATPARPGKAKRAR